LKHEDEVASAGYKIGRLKEQLRNLNRDTKGHSPESVVRRRASLVAALDEAKADLKGIMGDFINTIDEARANEDEIARLSRPGSWERLLKSTGGQSYEFLRARRLKALAAAKKSVGTTATDPESIAKGIKTTEGGDLAAEVRAAIADALVAEDGDSDHTAVLIERLRSILNMVDTLVESGKSLSALAPASVMEGKITNEVSRALTLAAKIRSARVKR